MNNCPSQELLFQFAEGDVPRDTLDEIESHLEHCEDCQHIFDEIPEPKINLKEIIPAMPIEPELVHVVDQLLTDCKQKFSDQNDEPRQELQIIGDFRILKEIGRGGMGIVYLAEQISLGRMVALKTLPHLMVLDEKLLQRFQREARAAANLKHKNIVPVYLLGEDDKTHFYVMSFIEGMTLAQVIQDLRGTLNVAETTKAYSEVTSHFLSPSAEKVIPKTTMLNKDSSVRVEPSNKKADSDRVSSKTGRKTKNAPLDYEYFLKVARLGIQAAEALDYAHSEGIIHRDIKPSNLMVDGSLHLWVTDFGLASVESETSHALSADLIVGTARYMSPEQASGDRNFIDSRTDIYSLGATLYELATLEPMFAGTEKPQLLSVLKTDEPKRPRLIQPNIPRDLETIILKTLSKKAHERYDTAQELAEDLRRFLENRPISAKPPTPYERSVKWIRRNRMIATLAMTIVISISSLAVGLAFHNQQITRAYEYQETLNTELENTNTKLENSNFELENTVISLGESQNQLRESLDAVQEHKRELKLRLYASQIFSVMQDMRSIPDVLKEYTPKFDEVDIRGFEWYYLNKYTEISQVNYTDQSPDQFYSMQVSPDGTQVAIGGSTSELIIYDIHSKSQIVRVNTQQTEIEDIAYSPNGEYIATIGFDGTTKIWYWNHNELHQHNIFQSNDDRGLTITFSPDGLLLVTAGKEEEIRIWDWHCGEMVMLLDAPALGVNSTAGVNDLTFSPDGSHLAAACNDGHLRVWETTSWKMKPKILAGTNRLLKTDFSPDGHFLVTGDVRNLISIWDIRTGKNTELFENGAGVVSTSFSDDGLWLVSGDRTGTIKYWPITIPNDTDDEIREDPYREPLNWSAHSSRVTGTIFLPKDKLMSCSWDGKLTLWDPLPKQIHQPLDTTGKQFSHFSTLPSGNILLTADQDGVLRLWELHNKNDNRILYQHHSPLNQVEISNDLRWLAVADNEGEILLWDLNSRKPASRLKFPDKPFRNNMQFSPDSKLFCYVNSRNSVALLDLSRVIPVQQLDQLPGINPVFSPDSSQLVLTINELKSGERNQIQIRDPANGEIIVELSKQQGAVDAILFSPDGKQLVTAGAGYGINIWNPLDGNKVKSLTGHLNTVWSLAFSPDGQTLISGDRARHVFLWQIETGQQMLTLPRQSSQVDKFAFTDGGRKIVLLKKNNTINVINTLSSHDASLPKSRQIPEAFKNLLPAPEKAKTTAGL